MPSIIQHVEPLEPRLSFNSAITGGPGHAGFTVDAWADHAVVGSLKVDFYARLYYGETEGTEGQSSSGNVITGDQGRIIYSYTPNDSVDDGPASNRKLGTTQLQDQQIARYIHTVGGPDINWLAGLGQFNSLRMDATGEWNTYYVLSRNCFSFAGTLADVGLRDPLRGSPFPTRVLMWDQLSDGLDRWFGKGNRVDASGFQAIRVGVIYA